MSLLADYNRHRQAQGLGQTIVSELTLPSKATSGPIGRDAKREQRRKTWEISPTFHCSIIGTCLTAAELRQFLVKLGEPDARMASDHVLHSRGVRAASERGVAGKLLNKALDRRHETMIKRFSKLSTADELRALWNECLEQGEISGAYWAVMSHPATDRPLTQEVFGEVHMLSHLVGSSSRLDLARLRALQIEVDAKKEKIVRQEERLHAAARDRARLRQRIDELEESLVRVQAARLAEDDVVESRPEQIAVVHRLEAESARADALSVRLAQAEERVKELEKRAAALAQHNTALQHEADSLEAAFAANEIDGAIDNAPEAKTASILYVGGRRNLFERLRLLASKRGIDLMIHDGGIEDNNTLLPGLVSQVVATVFPVDCISHAAAGMVKRLCHEKGKPFVPLRSASLASFIAAIAAPALFTDS